MKEESMHILERIDEYSEQIKQTPYVYKIQKAGIEIVRRYINDNHLDIREEDFEQRLLEKLILIWLPKNKKYLSETEVYQIIYTIHDIVCYIEKKGNESKEKVEENTILKLYGKEYMRVYKAKSFLQQMTDDPVISIDPIVIDLDRYKNKKKRSNYTELATTYEQGLFQIQGCKEGGQIILNKMGQIKQYKMLLEYPGYKYLKVGDLLQIVIKRKLFYVYWELEEIKAYYLPQACPFFNLS